MFLLDLSGLDRRIGSLVHRRQAQVERLVLVALPDERQAPSRSFRCQAAAAGCESCDESGP
jgi:hypothetical protein